MFQIVRAETLNPVIKLMEIKAPLIAKKAEPGQFVILSVAESSERVPLTIADYCRAKGTVTVIFQIIGATTEILSRLGRGDYIRDLAGPLGRPTETTCLKSVVIVGGGVGCASAYPLAKKLREQDCQVDVITGFRTRELVIFEKEFRQVSNRFFLMTDDGSCGAQGLVTDALRKLIDEGDIYDTVFAIGPLIMMKSVSSMTKKYGVKTIVNMNPIMIDGTGMCGGCRLSVGGKIKFACIDGPDFDGHLVDFYEAIARSGAYFPFECQANEKVCRLLNMEVR